MSQHEAPANGRWWAIRSKSTGHLATVGPSGQGAVLAYHDEADAQADASAMQISQPLMLWEPIQLPKSPPAVCLPDGYRREAREVAFMMKFRRAATGEVLHLRLACGPDVDVNALRELSAMLEGSSQYFAGYTVTSLSSIQLGELVKEPS